MPLTFYPEGTTVLALDKELRTLHKIADLTAAGGGVAGTWISWEDTGPSPAAPPADVTKAVMVRFRDGSPPVVWDPTLSAYV